MTRISRRAAVLSGLTAGTAALVAGPEALVHAAGGRSTPAAATLAAHLDVGQPSFIAFLREMGVNTALLSQVSTLRQRRHRARAPLCARSRYREGPDLPAAGYLVGEIRGGLYWITDGVYQCLFLVTGQGVIVVDAPPSIGPNLLKAIASVTSEPVTHLVYSHLHADHIGAAELFSPGRRRWMAPGHRGIPTAGSDPHRPVPTVTFTERYTLRVGDQVLQLSYKGENHIAGYLIYAPRQHMLMLVDVISPAGSPSTTWQSPPRSGLHRSLRPDAGLPLLYLRRRATHPAGPATGRADRTGVHAGSEGHYGRPRSRRCPWRDRKRWGTGISTPWAGTYADSVIDTTAAAMLAKWHGPAGRGRTCSRATLATPCRQVCASISDKSLFAYSILGAILLRSRPIDAISTTVSLDPFSYS